MSVTRSKRIAIALAAAAPLTLGACAATVAGAAEPAVGEVGATPATTTTTTTTAVPETTTTTTTSTPAPPPITAACPALSGAELGGKFGVPGLTGREEPAQQTALGTRFTCSYQQA